MMKTLDITEVIKRSVFLIGAGFSFDTGCLTSSQMFARIKDEINRNSNETFSRIERDALQFLISCLQYHSEWRSMELVGQIEFTPNIEELVLLIKRIKNRENIVPYPITGNWSDKLVSLESQFKVKNDEVSMGNDKELFEVIYDKLKKKLHEEWLTIEQDPHFLNYLNPIKKLSESYASETDLKFDIFSLNNDLVIETYFEKEYQKPFRGFVSGEWRGIYFDETGSVGDEGFGKINLYKLHGSVDWIRLPDGSCWEEEHLKKDNTKLFEQTIDEAESDSRIHYPYVIFGHGTKNFSVEPFFSLLNHFHSSLHSENKNFIFVIGYSFFDPYINNLLFDSAKDDTYLIIINPYFGPKSIYQACEKIGYKPKPKDREKWYECEYPEGKDQSELIDYLKLIQNNHFYSELPEFNYTEIRAENIKYLPINADFFLKEFFSDKGQLLTEFINDINQDLATELPFTDNDVDNTRKL